MQWLAMITMLIDHLGFAFFQDERILRLIGRIAFPIYCYMLVVGYQHTRSKSKYSVRLLILALLSQFPFMYAFNIVNLNVIFTLLFGLLLLIALDKLPSLSNKIFRVLPLLLSIILIAITAWIAQSLHTDYGAYGILLILIFRYTQGFALFFLHMILNIAFILPGMMSTSQMYSVLATLLIVIQTQLKPDLSLPRPPRWLWRAFYPAHLAVIAVIVQGMHYGYF